MAIAVAVADVIYIRGLAAKSRQETLGKYTEPLIYEPEF